METKETDLNCKLAEWAGWTCENGEFHRRWYPPGVKHLIINQYYENYRYLPDFLQSLDACLKWLIPKVDTYGLCTVHGNKHLATVIKDAKMGSAVAESAPLALCLAVEKLINGVTI